MFNYPCRLIAVVALGISVLAKIIIIGVLVYHGKEIPAVLPTLGTLMTGALVWIVHNDPVKARREGHVEGKEVGAQEAQEQITNLKTQNIVLKEEIVDLKSQLNATLEKLAKQ